MLRQLSVGVNRRTLLVPKHGLERLKRHGTSLIVRILT